MFTYTLSPISKLACVTVASLLAISTIINTAQAANISYTNDTTISVGGVMVTILSGSLASAVVVGDTTITITTGPFDLVTIRSSDRYILANSTNIGIECTDAFSKLVIAENKSVTVTPSSTKCVSASGGGGFSSGGGGGGGGAPAGVTVITPKPDLAKVAEEKKGEEKIVEKKAAKPLLPFLLQITKGAKATGSDKKSVVLDVAPDLLEVNKGTVATINLPKNIAKAVSVVEVDAEGIWKLNKSANVLFAIEKKNKKYQGYYYSPANSKGKRSFKKLILRYKTIKSGKAKQLYAYVSTKEFGGSFWLVEKK